MSDTSGRTVTIDGVQYGLGDLSDEVKAQLASLRFADMEIARLQRQLAIAQTARSAYARALETSLPRKSVST